MPTPSTHNPAPFGDDRSDTTEGQGDEKLLKHIRHRYTYMSDAWKDIRKAGDTCMRALSPLGPWDEKDREDRKKNGRPCIHLDQIGQYCNGFMGEVRQNPVGVKVDPAGGGATDTSANLRSDRLRQIAYDSNADQATLTALENAVERGYGAFGIITEYKRWDSDEQVIRYRRFANPDAVLWDPDCKEADWSDMQDAFYLDRYSFEDFKAKFPGAETTDFGTEHIALAPHWISKDWGVQVGEYWRIEKTKRCIYWIRDGSPKGRKVFKHQLPDDATITKQTITLADGMVLEIQNQRDTEEPHLKQYLTNGIEILDRTDFPGTQVPVFPIIGKERYITKDGKQAERVIYSYITMAIDGQMLFDYYKTNEAEEVGLTPKPRYAGYVGQFGTTTDWKNLNKITTSYVEFMPMVDDADGKVLPLPRWDSYTPNIAALDIGSESARRAIQAALGSYGFTKTDDTNVKSGVALKQLDRKGDLASYHLIDSYKLAIQRAGKVTNELLDAIEGTDPAERGIRKQDGTHEVVKLNQPSQDKDGQEQNLSYSPTPEAEHTVTISTGPSYQSQREEATALADTLIESQIPGIERILDLAVRLKDAGPIADEIADRLTLPEFKKDQQGKMDPAEVEKTIQQYEHALEDAMKQIEQLKQGLPKIEADQKNTQAKIASDQKIAEMKIAADKEIAAETLRVEVLKVESKEALTLMGHQIQEITGRLDRLAAEGQQATEIQAAAESQASEQEHATAQQEAEHAQAQQTQQADQAHQQEMQAGQQEHASAEADAQRGHEEGMQATDIAAQPAEPPTTSD